MMHLHFSTSGMVKTAIGCGVVGLMYMQPYRPMFVVGQSMQPTYPSNTFSWTEPVPKDGLKVGDVVVIDMKGGPIVKRIAYLPGDSIFQAKINNKWTDVVDVHLSAFSKDQSDRFRESKVPPGMTYVLGDNRGASFDSREFGCVPIDDIESKLVDQRPSSRW